MLSAPFHIWLNRFDWRSTLALVDAAAERFKIECLVAGAIMRCWLNRRWYRPRIVGLSDETGLAALQAALAGSGIEIVAGQRDCDGSRASRSILSLPGSPASPVLAR